MELSGAGADGAGTDVAVGGVGGFGGSDSRPQSFGSGVSPNHSFLALPVVVGAALAATGAALLPQPWAQTRNDANPIRLRAVAAIRYHLRITKALPFRIDLSIYIPTWS